MDNAVGQTSYQAKFHFLEMTPVTMDSDFLKCRHHEK